MKKFRQKLFLLLFILLSVSILAGNSWSATVERPHALFSGWMQTFANNGGTADDLVLLYTTITSVIYSDGSITSDPNVDSIIGKTVNITGARRIDVPGTTFTNATITITDGAYSYFSATLKDIVFTTDGTQWYLNPGLDVGDPQTMNLENFDLNQDASHPSNYIIDLQTVLGSSDIAGMKMILDVFNGDISGDSYSTVSGLIDGVQAITNVPPTALAGVTYNQEQCLDATCAVTLNGSESFDPDAGDSIVSYEWYEDNLLIATGEIATVELSLGFHEITLVVTDSNEAIGDVTITVVVDPAELSFIEVTKAVVFWNYDWIKIKGKLALPAGVSHESVNSVGSATINLSGGLGDVVSESVDFEERKNGRKWRYQNSSAAAGQLHKFKIDWYGDKFYYQKDHLRIKSHHFGDDTTTLEIEFCSQFAGPVNVEIGSVTVSIDADDNVTVTGATEYDVDTHRRKTEVEVVMPFNMITDLVSFDVSGTINDTVTIADYYTAAVGRFKIKAKFDSGGIDPETIDLKELLLDVRLGDEGFSGILVIDNDTWTKTNYNKWKYKAGH